MATFRTGPKTHPPVLPQQVALESESVDTPRIGHETGLRHHQVVPGAEHVRGETGTASPDDSGVTTRPQVGEKPRERHPSVFVLDKHHTPLQPCHPARARKLLAKGRAVVARHTPFTIRYVFPTDGFVRLTESLGSAPVTAKAVRDHGRVLFAGASNQSCDKQGRITIPLKPRDDAGLDRECVIIGADTRLEIWARARGWL